MRTLLAALMPDVTAVVARFPLAVLAAVALAAFWLLDLDKALNTSNWQELRLTTGLVAAFLLAMALMLIFEAGGLSRLAGQGLALAAQGATALLFAYPAESGLFIPFLLAGLAISVGLAPYLGRRAQNGAFWQFNHQLWLGALVAIAAGLVFAGGVSILLASIDYLFNVHVPRNVYLKVWTLAFTLIAPLNWLSMVPADFKDRVIEGEQVAFTSHAVALIGKYLLVPLVLAYTLILYAYALKIALAMELPRGQVGHMVLGYGAVGTISWLVVWPSRDASGPLVRLFWRHWFWLTVVPLVLLAIAIWRRIADYGLTEERYLVVLAGVWLGALALLHGLGRLKDIRWAPGLLAALLLAGAAGPWGATGLSLRSQVAELRALLERAGAFENGRIVSLAALKEKPDQPAKRRIGSILRYLARHRRLELIAPWFAGLNADPFTAARKNHERGALEQAMHEAFGVAIGRGFSGRKLSFSLHAFEPAYFALGTAQAISGPYRISPRARRVQPPRGEGRLQGLTFKREGLRLSVKARDGSQAIFDLEPLARATRERAPKQRGRAALLAPVEGELEVRLLVISLAALGDENGDLELLEFSFWLVHEARSSP